MSPDHFVEANIDLRTKLKGTLHLQSIAIKGKAHVFLPSALHCYSSIAYSLHVLLLIHSVHLAQYYAHWSSSLEVYNGGVTTPTMTSAVSASVCYTQFF